MFAIESEALFLCQRIEASIDAHRLDVLHPLDGFLNGLEVGQQPAEPALIDIELPAAFCFFFDRILRLALCSDEHEARSVHAPSELQT